MNKRDVFEGVALRPSVTYNDPNARFALMGLDAGGHPAQWPISPELLSRHMLLLGSIGTGKTNAAYQLIEKLRQGMTRQDVMIIFDTKGDYYNQFYKPGDIVISNDRRATGPRGRDYWNIFNEVMIDERLSENITEVANTMFSEKLKRTSQPFFPNAAKDILTGLMLHMARAEDCAGRRNNQGLRKVLDGFDVPSMVRILNAHQDLRGMSAYIQDPSSGQTLGVVSELQQAVREILIGNFAQNGTLSMRRIVRNKGAMVVFVEYDLGIGQTLSPIYQLLFDLAIKEALCRSANEGNVYFVIDEFRLLPHLNHIDDGVNFGRSLGAKFFLGVQNVEQVFEAYGKECARSILSGLSTLVCFRLNDGETRNYVKELLGKNISRLTFMSSVMNRGIVEELRDTNVAEDWDLSTLRIGEAIVRYAEHPPFRFQFRRFRG